MESKPDKEIGEILDNRIIEARRKLKRWGRAIAMRWIEARHFIIDKGLWCENTIMVEINGVCIFTNADEPGRTHFAPSPTSRNYTVEELATRPEFDIALLPMLRDKMIATIEDQKKIAERHIEKFKKAIEPLMPDIAEQALEDDRKGVKPEDNEGESEPGRILSGGELLISSPNPVQFNTGPLEFKKISSASPGPGPIVGGVAGAVGGLNVGPVFHIPKTLRINPEDPKIEIKGIKIE